MSMVPTKSQRVLACVLCQQRKVKCDRKFPCINCIKFRVQCIPSTLASRQRRRRFPERELLERVRKYEDLLRQNNIKFDPLHKESVGEKGPPNAEGGYDSDDEQPDPAGADWPSPSSTVTSERVYEPKNILDTMSQGLRHPNDDGDSSQDDVREGEVKKAWDQIYDNGDHLLFGSQLAAIDISTLHPQPIQIFKLWQIYLDNVNPLLKVTHTPSLQGRIIDAASNMANINPNLEVLMFSIYCISTLSLDEESCQIMFGSPKEDLLSRYQFGCQQALSNCGFLRSSDRDCLTALYLYLISVRLRTIPQSLSSMLGIAIRIAQRMGIDSESALAKRTALEAEMCRRLWWSLVLFDARISELADNKNLTLAPTWDCKIPLNVNDSDLRPEMKEPPVAQGGLTDVLFAVVRSDLGDYVRNSIFYLEFTNPALKPIVKDFQHGTIPEGGDQLSNLEKSIEDKYLKFCDPENPLHFMTIWTTRGYLAKCRLLEYHSKSSTSPQPQTEMQRDAATAHAFSMLECDTKIMNSPLTKGFQWLAAFYFPFIAYIDIIQTLKRRPISNQAEQAWEIMSDNNESRIWTVSRDESPFFKIFAKIISQAWEAREAAFRQLGDSLVPPRIVLDIRRRMAIVAQDVQNTDMEQPSAVVGVGVGTDDFPVSMPLGSSYDSLLYSIEGQDPYTLMAPVVYPDMPAQTASDVNMNQLHWAAMDWSLADGGAGEAADSAELLSRY